MIDDLWTCEKCKKKYPRIDLYEIFAWGVYVCERCINEWIYHEDGEVEERTEK